MGNVWWVKVHIYIAGKNAKCLIFVKKIDIFLY